MTEAPDYDKTAKNTTATAGGYLPALDKLQTDTALLRRIAYNTDVIRNVLNWTLVVVPLVLIAIAIILGVSAASNAPAPAASTASIACQLNPSNC